MQPYRPLPAHIAEQLRAGRTIIVELDAWYLPDTASTSYRQDHVKTSVAADAIDLEAETLRYFHNTGLHELRGDDYRGALRLSEGGFGLPPYTELVRFDAGARLEDAELRRAAQALLGRHLMRTPRSNPFARFGERLSEELSGLLGADLDEYHAYAFANVRMAGAAFEIAAAHAEWLLGDAAGPATEALREIVDGCKVLSFRLARRRSFDVSPLIEPLAGAWACAMDALAGALP
jgi:hypothetical protein